MTVHIATHNTTFNVTTEDENKLIFKMIVSRNVQESVTVT